jgi:hypothetical protein
MIIELLAQFDIIIIAIMLSGVLVNMGKNHSGTVFGDTHFKGFYLLFAVLILENILIVLFTNFFFLPFFEQVLFSSYLRAISMTVTLVLFCNIWFAWTFRYRQKPLILLLTAIATIITVFLFIYQVPA